MFVLLALLIVPASVLAGCIAEPDTQLTLRRGDLVRAELVLRNESGVVLPADASGTVSELCGADVFTQPGAGCPEARAAYTLAPQPPARLPEGWTNVSTLPAPLVDALSGLIEGETRVREGILAYGRHDPALVQRHDRQGAVSRFRADASAYGHTWNVTRLANGSVRLDPSPSERGLMLEDPAWCNERFCLFESRLVGWNRTHLMLEHRAREGQRVHVAELDTWLRVTDANETTFLVDGNDPRAGQRFDLYVHVLDIRGPPEGVRRAPGFNLTTVDGSPISLRELLGEPVVLEFFATWCPSCIENTEHLNRLEARFGERIRIVSIDVDPWEEPAAIRSFIRQNDVSWPVAVDEDGRVSQAYRVGSLSTEVIVSPSGAIVHTETGVADHDRVVQVIESLLEQPETAPQGPGGPP